MIKYIIWDWNDTRRRKVRFTPLACSANIHPLPCSSSRLETRFGSLWSPNGFRAAPRFLFLRRYFTFREAVTL